MFTEEIEFCWVCAQTQKYADRRNYGVFVWKLQRTQASLESTAQPTAQPTAKPTAQSSYKQSPALYRSSTNHVESRRTTQKPRKTHMSTYDCMPDTSQISTKNMCFKLLNRASSLHKTKRNKKSRNTVWRIWSSLKCIYCMYMYIVSILYVEFNVPEASLVVIVTLSFSLSLPVIQSSSLPYSFFLTLQDTIVIP